MLTMSCLEGEVILGVDTHRDTHAVVLVDPLGGSSRLSRFRRLVAGCGR